MDELLSRILHAHGGMDRWRGYEKVEATIVSGGGFFPLKGMIQDATPRRMTVWLHQERSSVCPYGKPDQRTMFTPERVAIEKLDGTLVSERHAPRDSFAGHQMSTPWVLFIAPISMAKRCGRISLRPSFWRWTACVSRKSNRGVRAPKRGTYYGHNFLVP